jgi:hypothetical protein
VIDLTVALRTVIGAIESLELPFMVVGSTAASAWGLARATRDVDLVVLVEGAAGESLLSQLGHPDLYIPLEEAHTAVVEGGAFNVLHPSTGGKVDVFVVTPDDEFEMMRLSRRRRAEVLGVGAWIASPEDVILAKLRWRLSSRSEVQWTDCVAIAATQSLDVDHLTLWAQRLGITDDLVDLLAEIAAVDPGGNGGGDQRER